MGRSLAGTLLGLGFKVAVLIVLTNLLFSFFEERTIVWEQLVDLRGLADKLATVTRALLDLLHGLLHAVLE